jgi:hypothetical protein
MLDKAESASLLVQMMKETEHGALDLLDPDIHLDQNGSCSFFSLLSYAKRSVIVITSLDNI